MRDRKVVEIKVKYPRQKDVSNGQQTRASCTLEAEHHTYVVNSKIHFVLLFLLYLKLLLKHNELFLLGLNLENNVFC